MKSLYEIIEERRDTRHFTDDKVPTEVLEKALEAGNKAPSVGLTDATRYFIIESSEIKKQVKELFLAYQQKASENTDTEEQKKSYLELKLEAIEEVEGMGEILRHLLVKLTREEELNPFRYHEAMAALQPSVTTVDVDAALEEAGEEVASDEETTESAEADKEEETDAAAA